MVPDREEQPPLAPHETDFRSLLDSMQKSKARMESSGFVKNLDIPQVTLSTSAIIQKALVMSERGLICKFTVMWPSPRSMEFWI